MKSWLNTDDSNHWAWMKKILHHLLPNNHISAWRSEIESMTPSASLEGNAIWCVHPRFHTALAVWNLRWSREISTPYIEWASQPFLSRSLSKTVVPLMRDPILKDFLFWRDVFHKTACIEYLFWETTLNLKPICADVLDNSTYNGLFLQPFIKLALMIGKGARSRGLTTLKCLLEMVPCLEGHVWRMQMFLIFSCT